MYVKVPKQRKIILLMLFGLVVNQTNAQYEIKKYSINNGGTTLSAGNYKMTASAGQTDASETLSAGNYSLNGGLWQENSDLIFSNGFE